MFHVLKLRSAMAITFCQARSAGRENCACYPEPPCPPQTPDPCHPCEKTPPKKYRPNQPIFNKPECCSGDCPELVPRYDDMYYKSSNKATRCYSQTWSECPEPIRVHKRCCFETVADVPIERRERACRPKTACPIPVTSDPCRKPRKCPRIVLPGCRSNRNTFHCLVERNPGGHCPNKRCTPYPSYSECCRPKPNPAKPVECHCLAIPELCMIWAEIEKLIREGRMNQICCK